MSNEASTDDKVRAVFDAFFNRDAEVYRSLLHHDYTFNSPYDDAIDEDAFMTRCWPGGDVMDGYEFKQIMVEDDVAFLLYELKSKTGETFTNTERFTFRDGLLYRVEVFFGDPQTGQTRWTNEDLRPAETVRKLIEDRYEAIRNKQADAVLATVAENVVLFDVIEPIEYVGLPSVRQRETSWFGGFEGPVGLEVEKLNVSADGDTAFAFSLNRYSGRLKGVGYTDMWVRHTSCYRLREQSWELVHEHMSIPFDPQTGRWSERGQPNADQSLNVKDPVAVLGQVACTNIGVSRAWYQMLFDRPADDTPMDGLDEWHHGSGGLQLFENPSNAGHSTLTLLVADISASHARLKAAGLTPGNVEPAASTSLVRLNDPDGNLIVLAQPGRPENDSAERPT